MFGVYEYLSQGYNCHYALNDGKIDILNYSIIITNHYINYNPKQKVVFYSTNPEGDTPKDLSQRRLMLNWLKNCDVVCASWVMAKTFYDHFRIKPTVQHPFIPEQETDQIGVVYSTNFKDIDIIKNELFNESFIQLEHHSDIAGAKIYLASSQSLIDLGLCMASTCGVPVILEDSHHLQEFLDNGDVVVDSNTPLNQKIQIIKKSLKEYDKLKMKSKRFANTPAVEDKIRKALSKKPITREMPPSKVNNPMVAIRNRFKEAERANRSQGMSIMQFTEPLKDNTIYVSGSIVSISGYDNLVYEVIKGLKSLNLDVRINSHNLVNYDICPSYFKEIHKAKANDAWEIVIVPPCVLQNQTRPIGGKSIVLTMWETDYLEPQWVKCLNDAAFVIVPSQWAVDSFKKCGVVVPIYKVPLGYDPLVFNQDSSYPTECVFGTAAALTAGGLRKNTNHVIKLFNQAFPNDEQVKLKIKITPCCPWYEPPDKRIEVTKTFLKPMELANWYRSTCAFINCSYAEGFGLHLIETMACGRTIISTKYSAVTEYFDESVGYAADHQIVPASGGAYSGSWGKPVDESIIKWMRHIYENREEARQKGEAAALRAKEFTWKSMGNKLVNILKENKVIKL